ncbi:predicted protein [Naegleria gruberi]|uniref:non-specific serine/threonine protein kinase n=1 Tax=Naegleria gruberi TaxID=5762 RepID=D2VWG0_NAEGR|nr:uncharacterized protein NAEGRDRAFT_73367 [Naegleria gruberi]EFC38831.1 predicted protein [Naegleria gruberi]|eukprot:XP_002671575.1 predicted protein [Naegleria gruberi strain NEG-M]
MLNINFSSLSQSDKNYILEQIKWNDCSCLEKVNETLKKDREFVLETIKKHGSALEYADESLKQDREFILTAVKTNGNSFRYIDEKFKKDREIVLEGFKENLSALEYADKSLKKDRDFMLTAVKQNGLALQHADKLLKKDRKIVLEAVKEKAYAFKYANKSFTKDREFMLEAIESNPYAFGNANVSFKKDRQFMLDAVKRNGLALHYYQDDLFRKDREIVLEAVKTNGKILKHLSESFRKDREVVFQAFQNWKKALKYASASLRNDKLFLYWISKHDLNTAREYSPHLVQIIENHSKLQTKLSTNIIDIYSKSFSDENELYYCLELPKNNPKSKSTLFNLNPTYSTVFIEKLVIFQIWKRLTESTIDIFYLESPNYYLFCFRLEKFLEENSTQPIGLKDLKRVVETISSKFETSHYNKKETSQILYFFTKWTESEKTFNNYKQILSKYNELHGDLSKIFRAMNQYYNYFSNDYDFISILGHGGEGVVLKVFHKSSRSLRAVKFKYNTEESEESGNELLKLLRRKDLTGKINYFDCGMIHNHLYSVMELGEESLADYISRNFEIYMNRTAKSKDKLIEILQIFIKVLESVKSIHDHNILHRDLDPQNIVKIQDEYKIIDFETSKVIKTGNSITIARGKYSYMSPEVSHDSYTDDMLKNGDEMKLAHNIGNITISCDLFSLGCILLKLLTNVPLQLDEQFIHDSDISKYNDNFTYFNVYGKYFFTVVTTSEGEMKLHYAIEKLINSSIMEEYGVNHLLIRCIITMIQRDSSKRLSCRVHKTTLESVVKFLKGESKELKEITDYKEIISLKSYSQLIEENKKLNENQKALEEKIKILEEEIRKWKLNSQ